MLPDGDTNNSPNDSFQAALVLEVDKETVADVGKPLPEVTTIIGLSFLRNGIAVAEPLLSTRQKNTVGWSVGTLEGCEEGTNVNKLGTLDGDDRATDGISDGNALGSTLGGKVGDIDGTDV